MRRQRNMAQIKEQIKTPEKELYKMEMRKLSDTQFITPVIRMLKELSEDFSSTKKMESETEDTIIEMKNNFQGTVNWIKLRIRTMTWNIRKKKNHHTEQQEEKGFQKMRIV